MHQVYIHDRTGFSWSSCLSDLPNPGQMRRPHTSQRFPEEGTRPISLMFAHLQFALGMYFRAMRTARPQDDPYLRPWKVAKDATWLSLLVLAYLQYYFMDVHAQIAALPALIAY